MDVVIPAAGIGSRFLPASRIVPKELLPLGGKPLIHHALQEAERAGFTRAVVVVSRDKTAIRSYFECDPDLERFLLWREDVRAVGLLKEVVGIADRLKITFVEQPAPFGLGDAVLRCRAICGDSFGVLLPDDVVTTTTHWRQLIQLHERTQGACFCVRSVPQREINRFGVAVCDGGESLQVMAVLEKPGPDETSSDLAIFGRYIVTTPVLEALKATRLVGKAELQLTDGFAAVLNKPPGVYAIRFTDDFFDNGTPEEYARSAARYVTQASTQANRS
jgi:UTP--glucose-1-phosphate uridylyltransferase